MKNITSVDIDLNQLLNKPTTPSEKFHHRTKIKNLTKIEIPSVYWPKSWKTVSFKGYSRFPETLLPKPDLLKRSSYVSVLKKRRSERKFLKRTVSLVKISNLLYYSAGLRSKNSSMVGNRFYPSGGARYPLEVYLLPINTVLPPKIYHYYPKNHSLECLFPLKNFSFKNYFNQPWLSHSAFLIIITAVFKRTMVKYGDRGYRHILLEAGHLGQNFYLTSAGLNLGCCAIGGYYDQRLEKLLQIDGVKESIVYVLAFGPINIDNKK